MRQSSLVKRLALFDFLDADDSSGQPIVRSAAECLTEVHYAGGLHALRSSLLYGKGRPVVWLDAHPDAQVQRPRLHELLHSLLGIPPPNQAWLSSLRAQTWLVAALKASRRAETLNDVDLAFQRTGWVVRALAMPGPWTWVGEVVGGAPPYHHPFG